MVEAIVVKLRFLCTETVYVHRHLHTWFQPALGAERTKGLNWNGDPLNHCLELCAIQVLLLHEYRDEVGDLFIVLAEHEVRHIAPLVQDALHLAIDDSHHRWRGVERTLGMVLVNTCSSVVVFPCTGGSTLATA